MADQYRNFYIQYLSNRPVEIEVEFTPAGEKRARPLKTVGHVIAAYKTAVAPLLDLSSLAELTLHLSKDSAEALEPDLLLSEISGGNTAKKPLFINLAQHIANDMELLIQRTTAMSIPGSSSPHVFPKFKSTGI